MFGIGFTKNKDREIRYLQDLLGETLERLEKTTDKAVRLEQNVIAKDKNISNLHVEMQKKTTSYNLLGKELGDTQELVVVLEEAVKTTSRPKRKRRQELSHKTGFTNVSEEESWDMFKQYEHGMDVDKIAKNSDRSQSCVSRHIRKHLEEGNNARREQVESVSGPEDAGIETQEQSS